MITTSTNPSQQLNAAFICFPCFVQHSVCFSEESCFFLQVTLPPLWQAIEVRAICAEQALEVHIRQVVLKSEERKQLG